MENTIIKKGKLYGVGVGPGDPDLITIKAIKAIENADIVLVPKAESQASTALNIVSKYLPENAIVEKLRFSMSKHVKDRINSRKLNAKQIEHKLNQGKNLAFITLGDPMLYSTYSYILEFLSTEYDIETIPGIYSFSAISSLLNIALTKGEDKLAVVSNFNNSSEEILQNAESIICMKITGYREELYKFLVKNTDYSFVMVTDAGKSTQKIYKSIEILREEIPYFSTALIQKTR